jgi:hypothetical protein
VVHNRPRRAPTEGVVRGPGRIVIVIVIVIVSRRVIDFLDCVG